MDVIRRTVGRYVFERQGAAKTATQLTDMLERSGRELTMRFQHAPQTEQNHRVVTHIIGIEKWSQMRIQVVQGAPFRDDEYDLYRPPRNTSWDDLKSIFEQTRRETVALTQGLSAAQLAQRVRHNSYGEMTAAAWLLYINLHSNLESWRIR